MARVLLGVSGGIAAYKACEVCRLLVKAGHDVVPLVTSAAERFVTAELLRARRDERHDVVAGSHEQPADLTGLVGGNAPCDPKQDSGHGRMMPNALRRGLRADRDYLT